MEKEKIVTDIIRFDLKIPYWVTFRIPTVMNFIVSYSVPPPTTIFGLIMNAMGKYQDDYSLRKKVDIATKVKDFGETIWDTVSYMKTREAKGSIINKTELQKIQSGNSEDLKNKKYSILKKKYGLSEDEIKELIDDGKTIAPEDFQGVFYTQSLQCERKIGSSYTVFIKIIDSNLSDEIFEALKNPKRSLYLGQSDDLVILENINRFQNVESEKVDKVTSIYPGIISNSELVNLPVDFKISRTSQCIKKTYSVFQGVRNLDTPILGYNIEQDYVVF